MAPESSTSIEEARETFGRPGISIMLPEITTTKPAPAELDFATVRPERFEIFFGEFEFARYGLNGKKSFLHEG
jgi:hypothetical protein